MHELCNVCDEIEETVCAADSPVRVSVPAEVGCDDVVFVTEFLSDPVPVAAVITSAMHQQHGRCILVAPVHIVQTQALRVVHMGRGPDHGLGHDSAS